MVLAHYWPMTTFVHHNPIRSLETLPFHDAVKFARRFTGGRGYFSNELYRQLVRTGRISYEHLDVAVNSIARSESVEIAGRQV
ncbi:putative inorganic carbon transporter subunit DabA, partial [Staphylococcus aureus]